MQLIDRVKEQAREIKDTVEDRVEVMTAKRKAGDLLEELGRHLYAERTNRAAADGDAQSSASSPSSRSSRTTAC